MANDHLNQYRTTLEQDEYKAKRISDPENLTRKDMAILVQHRIQRTNFSRHEETRKKLSQMPLTA